MRPDLLAISDEDLVALSNRGTVNRIQKELERGDPTAEFAEEEDGALRVVWSDGVECVLGAGMTLELAKCSCGSEARMCRHVLRTVVAYRDFAASLAGAEALEALKPRPWDPGCWSEEERQRYFPEAEMRRANRLWGRGLVMELSRGVRPTARFHRLGHRVRFVVPGSPAGAVCDCTEEAPCIHVLLAVRGFEELPAEKVRGVVAVGRGEEPLCRDIVGRSRELVMALVDAGLSSASTTLVDRLSEAAEELCDAGAIWLGALVEELLVQVRAYAARDARFSAAEVADLVGEFVLRLEAEAVDEPAVPRFFLVGHKVMGTSTMGPATLVGLGTMVKLRGKGLEILAMALDRATGRLVAISRFYEVLEDRRLSDLGRSMRELGQARMVVEKARVQRDLRLKVRQRSLGLYGQDLGWESLPDTVRVESFAELRERLELLAPLSLRPRRVGEGFFVVAVAEVREARFSARTQALHAVLRDGDGEEGELYHPFMSRGQEGLEALLAALRSREEKVVFTAGHVERSPGGFRLEPAAVVLEGASGRRMVQPWLEARSPDLKTTNEVREALASGEGASGLKKFLEDHRSAVGDGMLLGSEQALLRSLEQVQSLLYRAESLELKTFVVALRTWSVALERQSRDALAEAVVSNGKLGRWARDCGFAQK